MRRHPTPVAEWWAFAQALSNLCNGATAANGQATCSFGPTSSAPTYVEGGPSTGFPPSGAVDVAGCYPTGDSRNSYTYTGGGSTTQTTSVDQSISETVSIAILDLADVGIGTTTTWGQSFTRGVAYSNSFKINANYGYIAAPFWYPTIATATGDFVATLASTTYRLNQVAISTAGVPGTTTSGQHLGTATPTVSQGLMTRIEWNQNGPGIPAPPFLLKGRPHHR